MLPSASAHAPMLHSKKTSMPPNTSEPGLNKQETVECLGSKAIANKQDTPLILMEPSLYSTLNSTTKPEMLTLHQQPLPA